MDNSIHWWQSRTIWSALVGIISGMLALTGHTIDAGTQTVLINQLADLANAVTIIAGIAATYYRTQASTPIKPLTNGYAKTFTGSFSWYGQRLAR